MKMDFIAWLKDKEEFLKDEIENNRPDFTPIDPQRLERVSGALHLYDLWLEAGGVAIWRE